MPFLYRYPKQAIPEHRRDDANRAENARICADSLPVGSLTCFHSPGYAASANTVLAALLRRGSAEYQRQDLYKFLDRLTKPGPESGMDHGVSIADWSCQRLT